jgi:hypothetical protein
MIRWKQKNKISDGKSCLFRTGILLPVFSGGGGGGQYLMRWQRLTGKKPIFINLTENFLILTKKHKCWLMHASFC